ncbi:MAG: hypothetical protein Q9176_006041 [Flavoplaca citrina]
MELWEPHSSAPLNGHARDGGNHRSSSSASFASSQASRITRRNPLEKLAGKTKQLTKRLLDPMLQQEEHQVLSRLSDPVLRVLKEDPAFNPTKLDSKPQSGRSLAVKIQSNLQTSAAAVLHPKEGAKGKATRSTAGRLSKVERPYISKEMDHEFLEAHDKLSQAQSMATSDQLTPGPSEGDYEEKIEELKAQRESLRAAHTLSRHVQRVRVVPKRHIALPNKDDFVELDKEGRYIGYHWPNWIGRCLLYYTQDFSAQYIDDFDELPFTQFDVEYAYIIYMVIKNRYASSSVEALRISMRRVNDQRSDVYKLGELMDKHGKKHWLEPLLDELGPFVQLQLNDMANMLEVFANFHAWIYPQKTTATLVFLAACLAVSILTDMEYCMKIASFVLGGAFFFCWPISSLHPRYRYLVSPFKWVLWQIPTDAERAFMHLRRNAQITRESLIERATNCQSELDNMRASALRHVPQVGPNISVDATESDEDEDEDWQSVESSTSILDGSDFVSYRAFSEGVIGRLVVYSGGIRFVSSLKSKEIWRRSFLELVEMRKKDGFAASKLPMVSSQSLELKFIDNSKIVLDGMRERNSAFSSILGMSSLQWQNLQPETANPDSCLSL